MTDTLQIIFTSLGGTATALTVAAFMSKSVLAQLFAKEIENHKAELTQRNGVQLETLKAELTQRNSVQIEKLKAELVQDSKMDDRLHEYTQVMMQYQGPLQHAIYDLQSRIYNIVMQDLITVYVTNGTENEKQYVINNTAFVIAQYFSWAEIIRSEIQFIDCSTSENTRKLSDLQDNIYTLWQTDGYSGTFRFWAGEQRAIGELLTERRSEKSDRLTCIGYAKFLQLIDQTNVPLLQKLLSNVEDFTNAIAESNERLINIQHSLIDLLCFLDPEFTRFPKNRRSYIPTSYL